MQDFETSLPHILGIVYDNTEWLNLKTYEILPKDLIQGKDIIAQWHDITERHIFELISTHKICAYYYGKNSQEYNPFEWACINAPVEQQGDIWSPITACSFGAQKIQSVESGIYKIGIEDLFYMRSEILMPLRSIAMLRREYANEWDMDESQSDCSPSSEEQLKPEAPVGREKAALKHGGSNPDEPRIRHTKEAAQLILDHIKPHLDSNGKIDIQSFISLVKESMTARGSREMFHPSACQTWARANLGPHKLGRGEKLQ